MAGRFRLTVAGLMVIACTHTAQAHSIAGIPEAKLWNDLGDENAVVASCAIRRMLAHPENTLILLERNLAPIAPALETLLQSLLRDLESSELSTRRKATEQLKLLGDLSLPALRGFLRSPSSLESAQRARVILTNLNGPEVNLLFLRELRAIEVLEYIGSPAAAKLLAKMAAGAPEHRVTEAARVARERLSLGFPPPPAISQRLHMTRFDECGDELPKGAIARFGSKRLRHEGAAHLLTYSSDGKVLVTKDAIYPSSRVCFWDLQHGKLRGSVKLADNTVFANGEFLVARQNSTNRSLDIIEVGSGRGWTLLSRSVPVAIATRAPRLAFASQGKAVFWDLHRKVATQEHDFPCVSLEPNEHASFCLSPNGMRLAAAGSKSGKVQVLDIQTGQTSVFGTIPEGASTALYSGDGAMLIVLGNVAYMGDNVTDPACIYRWVDGRPLAPLRGPQAYLWSGATSPDGRLLVTAGSEASQDANPCLVVWDLAQEKVVRKWPMSPGAYGGISMAFSPDGRILAIGDGALTPKFFDVATGAERIPHPGHSSTVRELAFSADGSVFASASPVEVLHWSLKTGQRLKSAQAPQVVGAGALEVRLSTDQFLQHQWKGEALSVMPTETWEWPFVTRRASVFHRPLSPVAAIVDSKGVRKSTSARVCFDIDSGEVVLRNAIHDGAALRVPWQSPSDEIPSLVTRISPNGELLALWGFPRVDCLPEGDSDTDVDTSGRAIHDERQPLFSLWETTTGKLRMGRVFPWKLKEWAWLTKDHPRVAAAKKMSTGFGGYGNFGETVFFSQCASVSVCSRGRFAALGHLDRVYLWDLIRDQISHVFHRTDLRAETAAFSLQGSRLAALTTAGSVLLFDPASTREPKEFHAGSRAECFAFSPDGRHLATGHSDTTILLWEL